jgi:DNA-binding CsgD family transcriptional regulator/tetratricopeptide (TPR) repeat protein
MERGEELPLIGRAEELAFLTEAITERGGAVVGGAAGVGKTRLAREVSATLPGWHVMWATATRAVSDLPLGSVAGLDLADGETAFHGRAGLLSRLTEILVERSGGRPMLVVIDDTHLLDGLSAALVHHLSASGAAAVLLTMRAGDQPPSDVVSLYKDGPLPRLELEPLGQQDFATLASAALGGDVEPDTLHGLWRDTAGNVLFLRELVADAVEAGTLVRLDGVWRWTPDGRVGPRLAELVADRMGRLEGDRRLLAELLAVGEPLGADLVQALVRGLDLADEERRGTIVAEESGRRAEVRLAHPLFGEVLRARIPVLQRRRLQRLLADALEAVGSRRRGDVLRLATWRVESASPVDAGLLLRAARLAREVFDFAVAARLARASRDLAPSFEAGLLLGASLSQLGQFDAAGRVLNRLAGTEPDGTPHQLLVRERAWVMFHGPGGLAGARRVLEEAEASVHDPVRRLLARADLARLLTYSGRFTEALAIGGPLIAPDMDVRVRLRSLSPVGACMAFAGRAGHVLALCDELDAAAARLREELPDAVGWVWAARTSALLLAGRLDEITTVLAEPLEPGAAPIVGAGDLAHARTKLGRALLLQGRPASALRQLSGAAAVLRTNDSAGCLVWCLSLAAEAHGLLGHLVEAGRLADEAMTRRPSGLAVFDGDAARARAWVTAAAGERSRAIGQLVTAADDQESRGQPAYAMFALHDALRLGAKHVADRLGTLAASLDGPWPAAGVVHARAADASDAVSLEAAADAFAALGAGLVAAEAAGEASARWAASGHAARAAAARAKAVRLSPCEAGHALRFILPHPEEPGLATLTRREQEVAELACRGLSNACIAERLVVSVRTVESHLYSAYGKLGVSDRAALAAVLGSQ